jgi:phospholipase C
VTTSQEKRSAHSLEDLATLSPGETLAIVFHPDPGGIIVFLHIERVLPLAIQGTGRVVGRHIGSPTTLAARGSLHRETPPGAIARARLPGRLIPGNVRDPRHAGDVTWDWDPPPSLPTTYNVAVAVGPLGGPYQQVGPLTTRSLQFNGPVGLGTAGGGAGGDGLAVDPNPTPTPGDGVGPPRRPPPWECRITNIDDEKRFQIIAHVTFAVNRVVETDRIPRGQLTTLFEGALRWITPVIGVRFGNIHVGLPEDAAEVLEVAPLPPISISELDISDLAFTLEPVRFRVISVDRMFRDCFAELEDELRDRLAGLAGQLQLGSNPFDVPADFVDRLVTGALSSVSVDLPELVTDVIDPPFLREVVHDIATAAFTRLDIPHQAALVSDDVVLNATMSITGIRAAAEASIGTGEVFIDSMRATFYAVLRTSRRFEPHPGAAYAGESTLVSHLSLLTRFMARVGDLDVDLEGETFEADVVAEVIQLGANLFDDSIRGRLESALNEAVRGFLATKEPLNAAIESVVMGIAQRDDLLDDIRLDATNVLIDHFDPRAGEDAGQFRPRPRQRPIGRPIDGPMPPDADQRLQAIEHIVVVTMENRSFDNMLGYLSHPDPAAQPSGPRRDIDGLTGDERIPPGGNVTGEPVTPRPISPKEFRPDPAHGYDAVQIQIGPGGAMDGFLAAQRARILESTEINADGPLNDEANIVHFQPASEVPVFDYLADEFCVLDRYFCAFPGATQPNRVCMLTGATPVLRNSEFTDDLGYLAMPTLFDMLNPRTTSWRYYEADIGFLRVFDRYRLDFEHLRPLNEFLLGTERLPAVTFIDPNFKETPSEEPPSDDHAPAPVCRGQALLARIMNRLRNQPEADRDSTLLIVTYDEHGGFYDHVAPPGTAAFDALNPDVDRVLPLVHPEAHSYGVRVPALLASPLISAQSVSRHIYDHTSITRTILQRFAPNMVGLMPQRVRRSRHFGELLGTTPRPSIRQPPDVADAGCRRSNLLFSTPASPFQVERIAPEPDDERVTLQLLGTHGLR